jgi:Zn-finger nucleic acid-binding protein
MSDPYRDQIKDCPACKAPLREFQTRLVCDACSGMMLTLADLATGVHDLTSITPTLSYRDEKPGTRECPHCRTAMTTCKLTLGLEDNVEKPRPVLDRCEAHGLWFDNEELAKVFEKVAGKGHGSGEPHKTKSTRDGGDQGRWSAVFKKFGGHGGF